MEDVVAEARRWTGRRVLVTGCTGLIGAWLADALCEAGADVLGTARRPPAAHSAFVRLGLPHRMRVSPAPSDDVDAMRRLMDDRPVAAVFHLAGCSQVNAAHHAPCDAFEANVRGAWSLFEAVRLSAPDAPTVLASTAAVYGHSVTGDCDESSLLAPASAYAASKAAAEMIGQGYRAAYGLRIVALRCTNVYGGGDPNRARLIPSLIDDLQAGRTPRLRSDGASRRDFVHVHDVAAGFLRAASRLESGDLAGAAFNLSSGSPVSIAEVARELVRLAGRPDVVPEFGSGVEESTPSTIVSPSRARTVMGWAPTRTLHDGLAHTIAWHTAAADVLRHETTA